jgi:hypothetical protein
VSPTAVALWKYLVKTWHRRFPFSRLIPPIRASVSLYGLIRSAQVIPAQLKVAIKRDIGKGPVESLPDRVLATLSRTTKSRLVDPFLSWEVQPRGERTSAFLAAHGGYVFCSFGQNLPPLLQHVHVHHHRTFCEFVRIVFPLDKVDYHGQSALTHQVRIVRDRSRR